MLNQTKAVELRKMMQELKETVQSLEIFMNSIYWFKDANKTDYLTACKPAKTTGDNWEQLVKELFAISEQIELAGNAHHQEADLFYQVANQLHALNLKGETDEMTQKQKKAFFSLIKDDYIFLKAFNQMKQEYDHNTAKNLHKGRRK